MFKKSLLLAVLLTLFPIIAIYAQEENLTEGATEAEETASKHLSDRPDFWMGLGFNMAFYDLSGFSIGGSFALGYGSGSSIGFIASYFLNNNDSSVLELDLLLRFYFLGKNAFLGPFFQVVGGVSFVNYKLDINIPSNTGIFNAGLGFGWRLIAVDKFYWEPSIRVGYPYYCSFVLTVGIRT